MGKFDDDIEKWVRWFRGLNNPETQRKVAERQISMLEAERRMTRRVAVYGAHRGSYMTIWAENDLELEQMDHYMSKAFPKVPSGPQEPGDRDRSMEEREDAMERLIELLERALKKRDDA